MDRFRPNEVTYTLAIDACAKVGDSRRACELLREMGAAEDMDMDMSVDAGADAGVGGGVDVGVGVAA